MGKTKAQLAEEQAEKKAAFLVAFEKNATNVKLTCQAIGISRRTFYKWRDADEEFRLATEDAAEGVIDFAESKLLQQINSGNIAAIIFFLKTRAKHRGYIEQTETALTGALKVAVEKVITDRREEGGGNGD